ncbi:pirin family protein [Ectothiorhodospiraceae bacterium WFHF3C12]|nr:pirin family protein [Ectothiorhodospiraceae bacterium WFHF3C12]
MTQRRLARIVPGMPTSDGAGVRIRRSLGQGPGARLDPFLMLDELGSDDAADYMAGFPTHPHRGFETVTYMLEGRMRHRDHMGNEGLLQDGGLQWMSAGRGIMHSEMPEQTSGRMQGFQLWINLPAAEKMKDPSYEDIQADRIPERTLPGGGLARILAGDAHIGGEAVTGPVSGISTQPLFLDLRLPAGGRFEHRIPPGHSGFFYVYRGAVGVPGGGVNDGLVEHGNAGVLSDGEVVAFEAASDVGLLLLAARPLGEPVVQYGPFVMNSREEIEQALRDYQAGTLAGEARQGLRAGA